MDEVRKMLREEYEKMMDEVTTTMERTVQMASSIIRQRIEFLEGILLGIFFGIVGNFFVASYFGVFERLVLGNFDQLFQVYVGTLVVASALIIIAGVAAYARIKKYVGGESELSDVLKQLCEMQTKRLEKRAEEKISEMQKKMTMKSSRQA